LVFVASLPLLSVASCLVLSRCSVCFLPPCYVSPSFPFPIVVVVDISALSSSSLFPLCVGYANRSPGILPCYCWLLLVISHAKKEWFRPSFPVLFVPFSNIRFFRLIVVGVHSPSPLALLPSSAEEEVEFVFCLCVAVVRPRRRRSRRMCVCNEPPKRERKRDREASFYRLRRHYHSSSSSPRVLFTHHPPRTCR
jgi:hypothetical protein